ncbi:hypothetical protein BDV24DRAFT_158902 [Aspergillus arachidicola]|uniref:Uncharacterized protein n=1 Tax=Aspergillus arachidicola TaxID=656916 RepID=A0A5N6YKW5_9EURO|nr:hypothetical protein BDV24DRAFT_158902 [Aspergillus arachidicola]
MSYVPGHCQLLASHRSRVSTLSGEHVNQSEGESPTVVDGRTLGFHLYGAPDGTPVFYLGVVDTGIAPDRPGIGKSTIHPGRSILGYPDDIRQLINHLGLNQ